MSVGCEPSATARNSEPPADVFMLPGPVGRPHRVDLHDRRSSARPLPGVGPTKERSTRCRVAASRVAMVSLRTSAAGTTVQRLGSDDPLASPNTSSESGKTRQTLVAPG
ncbi:hypothetical protein GCM10023257_11260 [Streptomyces hyderabadensis]|uniref:Uncharacterized protein n=1 Tax=Streptomyces hyderabadensis TaxID=598549 RepID=A0ABP9HR27_9ACTN